MEQELMVVISRDGDQWCALYGVNIQEGCVGFGDTKASALKALADDLEHTGVI